MTQQIGAFIAQTIIKQLGGDRFCAITGASGFVDLDDGLMFSLPQRLCKNKANEVRVTLNDSDTYSVEFFSLRGVKVKPISDHSMVYAEALSTVISEETGLVVCL